MNDSIYSNTSDIDYMNDIELIMQAIKQDQLFQQNEAESSCCTRKAINRERDLDEARILGKPFIYITGMNYYLKFGIEKFERVASANSDLTVLNNSPLFDDLLDDIAPMVTLDQVVITLASGERGQGFDPYSLQGRMSFSTFGRTGSNLSTLGRGMVVYVSTSPIHRATVLDP
ncbi:hypothetical protein Tco_1059928 [Tanacetum coccineum]